MRPVEKVLDKLDGVEEHKGFHRALCPAHDDRNTPNLDITEGNNGQALVVCRAGCNQGEVLEALEERGVRKSDLFERNTNGAADRKKFMRTPRKTPASLPHPHSAEDHPGSEAGVQEGVKTNFFPESDSGAGNKNFVDTPSGNGASLPRRERQPEREVFSI